MENKRKIENLAKNIRNNEKKTHYHVYFLQNRAYNVCESSNQSIEKRGNSHADTI